VLDECCNVAEPERSPGSVVKLVKADEAEVVLGCEKPELPFAHFSRAGARCELGIAPIRKEALKDSHIQVHERP
jgi:hypothetical protein